ncbi:Quinone oxidoreductase 1 [Gammaproteobacteria bacterium]|nr:quinone oxidoreductase [Gammaproteobacteria bacterium]QOJ33064.1 MAG: quinone oxidoreductase [Gammaproteobacteria bacterium]CAG0942824.1 Quinone oxidoreductase 1 [Gammaproteobacteria bacterium]
MKAIQINRCGGPEVLEYVDVPEPVAAPGQAVVRQTAIGLNFIDTYHRSGLYPLAFPAGLGMEAAGVVEAVGPGVASCAPGDRVAYCTPPPGAYAAKRAMAADRLVKLPAGVDDRMAAAAMLKGLTAWYLLRRSYPVRSGDTVLAYAAAGGVGLILGQWARSLGVRAIGVAGTPEKAELARAHGYAEVILADAPDFVARVRGLTGGAGVAAVYDSVGKASFTQSLDCLRKHGVMVSYGNASGPVEPFTPLELARRGSLYLTRPSLFDFIAERAELEAGTAELFALITGGGLKLHIGQTYPLADVARAHRDLEARRTTGSTLLLP